MSGRSSDPSPFTVEELADDEVLVSGDQPGPAGLSAVSFLDGAANLAVDTADPSQVVRLSLPTGPDDRVRRLVDAVLDAASAADLLRWMEGRSPRPPGALGVAPEDPRIARLPTGRLELFGRLAVGLEELLRPDLTEAALAAALVDLGASAFDLSALGPGPDGAALVTAGLERWESLDSDAWDEESQRLLAAISRKRPQWMKSLWPHDPALVDRLEVLSGELSDRMRHVRPVAAYAAIESLPEVTRMATRAPAPGVAAGAPAVPVVDVSFDADLDGRLISAERVEHHLVVHLGGLADAGDLWLRVYELGSVPRLLAIAPVGAPERTWRTAVALVGPDVADHDLAADVTRHPREPFRSPAVHRTERAVHLGRVAARAARNREQGDGDVVMDAWDRCAEAWDHAGDQPRADQARRYAEDPLAPRWATTDPLLTDLSGQG